MDLPARLRLLVSLVLPGQPAADIGTDHGMLAVALALEGICPRVLACDVGEAPLAGARARVAQRWKSRRRVELRLGDGLAPLAVGEVATVVIAGMGGERIKGILSARPDVVAALSRLVLQPNTEPETLRAFVAQAGHLLEDEHLLCENGRWYPVLVVRPGAGAPVTWDDWDLRWGPLLRARQDPALRPYLGAELPRAARALAQARAGGARDEALAPLIAELQAIEAELARLSMAPGALKGRG